MADMCLCALAVEGPVVEVRRFVAATKPSERRNKSLDGEDSHDCDLLSFQRLDPRPNDEDVSDIYGTPSPEPMDCSRTRIRRIGKTRARIEYRFLTKWSEPSVLFRRVSRRFPRLIFLLGAVAPALDEADCWFFREGRGRNWKMSDDRREAVRAEAYRAEGKNIEEDDDLWLDIEGDHILLREVVAHWTPSERVAAETARRRSK